MTRLERIAHFHKQAVLQLLEVTMDAGLLVASDTQLHELAGRLIVIETIIRPATAAEFSTLENLTGSQSSRPQLIQ